MTIFSEGIGFWGAGGKTFDNSIIVIIFVRVLVFLGSGCKEINNSIIKIPLRRSIHSPDFN